MLLQPSPDKCGDCEMVIPGKATRHEVRRQPWPGSLANGAPLIMVDVVSEALRLAARHTRAHYNGGPVKR